MTTLECEPTPISLAPSVALTLNSVCRPSSFVTSASPLGCAERRGIVCGIRHGGYTRNSLCSSGSVANHKNRDGSHQRPQSKAHPSLLCRRVEPQVGLEWLFSRARERRSRSLEPPYLLFQCKTSHRSCRACDTARLLVSRPPPSAA